MMDCVLIIDKPAGITSHDVVSHVRRILQTRRVGHTGTLDPFATGVVVILVGKATRLAQFLDKDAKEYEATIRFGFETDTGDVTGLQIANCELQIEEICSLPAKVDWGETFSRFRGKIEQVPPMYSAKKIEGKKLYELARKGLKIERKPVEIEIHELELIKNDEGRETDSDLRIRVVCSAGTYIRTLAEDIGRAVGTGAHLAELRRTRAGKFDLNDAVTLNELAELESPEIKLISMETAVSHLSQFVLTDERIEKTKNGLSTRVDEASFSDGEAIRMIDAAEKLIAVGRYKADEKAVLPKVVLI